LEAKKILVSPSSGIIDSHGLMTALRSDVEMNGGLISLNTSFKHAKAINGGFQISLDGDDYQDYQITSKNFINAAGLNASFVAQNIEGLDQKIIPNTVFAKGHYLKLSKAAPFSRLIYPLPENGSLGIHFTLDLDGNGKFGPDLEWVNREDYSMSNININKFITTIKQYYPSLQNSNLHPDYCGIRPKLGSKNNFAKDFFIQTFSEHGINGLVNLYGIESPGLTSSLALPEEISKHIND
jgi:L-2-hydroxyglutarate oxidase LhgO